MPDHVDALGGSALPAEVESELRSLIERWTSSRVEGAFDEWLGFWSEDAVLMPPNSPRIVGRDAIEKFIRTSFGNWSGFRFSEWSFAGHDDLAVVANTIDWQDADGVHIFNQIIVLRRHAGSNWRVQTVIVTPAAAPR